MLKMLVELFKLVKVTLLGGAIGKALGFYAVMSICSYISYLDIKDGSEPIGAIIVAVVTACFWLFNLVDYLMNKDV